MKVINEGKLSFEFDDSWDIALDYDEPLDSDYVHHVRNDKVSAVDIVAVKNGVENKQLLFIEVKDMSGREKAKKNVQKLDNRANDLTSVIARNIRDSIYGILLGARKSETEKHEDWNTIVDVFRDEEQSIKVILWLEADLTVLPILPTLHIIQHELKSKLNKLTAAVAVRNIDNPVPTIRVTSLP